jgi:hydrogenase maturation protease
VTRPISLLVLGLGNRIWGDDGAGSLAVDRLARDYVFPHDVQCLDGGTLGLSLLPYLEDSREVILLDAIRAHEPAGSFVKLTGEDVAPAVRERLSPHQIGVADLLAGLELVDRMPDRLVLLGLVPERLEFGLDRSDAVEAAIPMLVERAVEEARSWGYDFVPALGREPEPSLRGLGMAGASVRL